MSGDMAKRYRDRHLPLRQEISTLLVYRDASNVSVASKYTHTHTELSTLRPFAACSARLCYIMYPAFLVKTDSVVVKNLFVRPVVVIVIPVFKPVVFVR